jgi:nucleoside-triphosphatase THEP1
VTNWVLTGPVHVGKTTVCHTLVGLLRSGGYRVRGILTPAILDPQGVRLGIAIVNLADGEQRELARVDRKLDGPQVGPYSFDLAALQWGRETIAAAIASRCDLLLVDEIGRLELERSTGFYPVLPLLTASQVPNVLVVVRQALLELFRRQMPGWPFATVEVSLENRSRLPDRLADSFFAMRPIE